MRNLRTIALEEATLSSQLPLTATAWDTRDDSVICAFGPTERSPVIELKRRASSGASHSRASHLEIERFTSITSWDAPCPLPDLDSDEILHLEYFSDTATASLVLAGGDLVVVREHPHPGQEKIEIVGSVDVGIAAAAWAPDRELLAIVTREDTLVLMSRDFEPVTETRMSPDDLKASKHVSVGWGKKETQFQGKRAKALRDPTMPETVDEGKLSTDDDSRVSVSWRGDGAFVAINSIVSSSRRVIRVYTRDAALDSASEPVDGLQSALSWRPVGNLIAGTQRHQDRVDVVFFERNGLRHGEFPLRLSTEDLGNLGSAISLSWNIDSSVLAISFQDRVQLWTMGNYHYYLKQEILSFPSDQATGAIPFRWHPTSPLKCTISMPDSLLNLDHLFDTCRGSTIYPYDFGIVAVVDGAALKLTPLKTAAVPPPMAFCEITTHNNIVACSISENGQQIGILTTHSVEVYEWKFAGPAHSNGASEGIGQGKYSGMKPTSIVSLVSTLSLSSLSNSSMCPRFTQIEFCNNDKLCVLAPPQREHPGLLRTLFIEERVLSLSFKHAMDSENPELENKAIDAQTLVSDPGQSTVWTQSPVGTNLVTWDSDSVGKTDTLPGATMQSAVYHVETETGTTRDTENTANDAKQYHLVTLNRYGDLCADGHVLSWGCTSFLLTGAHLIFTTSQHLLKFVHLAPPAEMEIPGDTPEVDERCRNIERGARLVTAVPSAYSVILQMPRGNLETIYPRVLVLAGIRLHILNGNFKSAFLACQTYQVDMNILYDYRPDLFLPKIPQFIDQLKKVSRIDEFLSKLKDEDVSQTLYRDTLKSVANPVNGNSQDPTTIAGADSQPVPLQIITTGKTNRICDAFIEALRSKPSSHLQNIITAYVAKHPPDLTSALKLITNLRQTSSSSADSAVSHLCFLTDANRLYDTALSLYDLELTLLVAQNSQRDPREYIPFLQSLHELPQLRRQFQIDNHLRNYSSALRFLHALKVHDEVESYTIKHSLYTTALDLYKHDPPHLTSMTQLYAAHLASTSRPALAAILYESLQDYAAAYPLHALAHHWREALTCASLVPIDAAQMRAIATSLAATCADEFRNFRAAATIHTEYLSDIPGAAKLLCKGSYFAEASRLLSLHAISRDKFAQIIDAGLSEKFGEILELLADCKGQLGAQVPRITELRKKKAEDPLAFYGGDPALLEGGANIPDNISLAPTDATTAGGMSLFTRYGSNASKFGGTVASNVSRKTSKTVRREERKRARGKKGSVYEEEYLIASVSRLIERVNGVQEEVGRLVSGLLRIGLEGREKARAVDERMVEVMRRCEEAKESIWTKESVKASEVNVEGTLRPSGADGVFWDSQVETGNQGTAKPPEVKVWKSPEVLLL